MPPINPPDSGQDPRLRTAFRLIAVLMAIVLTLLIAVIYLCVSGSPDANRLVQLATIDPELKEKAVRELVTRAGGSMDSHPDPEVGRVLSPNYNGKVGRGNDVVVSTNSYGIRERQYELPKPPGVVRIVMLGDSFVFGLGVALDDRCGRFLEESLRARAIAPPGVIEVLQIGIPSWNILAECAYLRRQLGLLQPDLVVHVVVHNDIDDSQSVRGFGVPSTFTDQHRERAGSLIFQLHAMEVLGGPEPGVLHEGLDFESRERYRAAGDAILRASKAVAARGGAYLLLLNWRGHEQLPRHYFASRLREDQIVHVSKAFQETAENRISASDNHWSRIGNVRISKLLYGVIVERHLLPRVSLQPWKEADDEVKSVHIAGLAEATADWTTETKVLGKPLQSEITWPDLNPVTCAQIHGGIDKLGFVSPYAALVLKRGTGRILSIRGRCLPRSEIDGAHVQILIDEFPVATLELRANEPIRIREAIPDGAVDRPYVGVRFVSDDFAYQGNDLRSTVSLQLEQVAIVSQ